MRKGHGRNCMGRVIHETTSVDIHGGEVDVDEMDGDFF